MSHHSTLQRLTQFLALLCLFALLLTGCSSPAATVAAPLVPTSTAQSGGYWPTADWRTSSPEDQGMDSQKLAEMLKAVKDQGLNLHSLLIIRNGYLVSENYFGPYQADTRHELYSVTKSFIATLIGIALDKGYIDGTDRRIVDFFPDDKFDNLDEQKMAMTLDDVLTMRTGLSWQEGDPAYRALYMSPDWVKFMLDQPMNSAPGTQFNYCSGCSHILSALVQQTTHTNPRDFAEQYLFKPLGISNVAWDTNADGTPIGGWGLWLTPRDMAKLGYLYLHKGQWDGQQIVSTQWVENATRAHTPVDGDQGYGYQWWTRPALKAYAATGRGGQLVLVIPELDLIVVTTAEVDNHDPIFQIIQQYIVPAVQDAR